MAYKYFHPTLSYTLIILSELLVKSPRLCKKQKKLDHLVVHEDNNNLRYPHHLVMCIDVWKQLRLSINSLSL